MAIINNFLNKNKRFYKSAAKEVADFDATEIDTSTATINAENNINLRKYLMGNAKVSELLNMTPDEYDSFLLKISKPDELQSQELQDTLLKAIKIVQKEIGKNYKKLMELDKLNNSPTANPRKIVELEGKIGYLINKGFTTENIYDIETDLKTVMGALYNNKSDAAIKNNSLIQSVLNKIRNKSYKRNIEQAEDEAEAKAKKEKISSEQNDEHDFTSYAQKSSNKDNNQPKIDKNIKKATVTNSNNSNLWGYLKDNSKVRNQLELDSNKYNIFLSDISKSEQLQSKRLQEQLLKTVAIVQNEISISYQELIKINSIINADDTDLSKKTYYEEIIKKAKKNGLSTENLQKIQNDLSTINEILQNNNFKKNTIINSTNNNNLRRYLKDNDNIRNKMNLSVDEYKDFISDISKQDKLNSEIVQEQLLKALGIAKELTSKDYKDLNIINSIIKSGEKYTDIDPEKTEYYNKLAKHAKENNLDIDKQIETVEEVVSDLEEVDKGLHKENIFNDGVNVKDLLDESKTYKNLNKSEEKQKYTDRKKHVFKRASDWIKNGYKDRFAKFENRHSMHKYSTSANVIVGAIIKNKIDPTQGLKAILDKSNDIKSGLPDTSVKSFDYLTGMLKKLSKTEAFADATKYGGQMRYIASEIIKDAVNNDTMNDAKIALETLAMMRYGNTTSSIRDNVKKDENWNLLGDKSMSWNKHESMQFMTNAADKTIKAFAMGVFGIANIAKNKIRGSGLKFKNGSRKIKHITKQPNYAENQKTYKELFAFWDFVNSSSTTDIVPGVSHKKVQEKFDPEIQFARYFKGDRRAA